MKVKIELNPIAEIVAEVRKAVADNDGYCPCKIGHIPDNKCMCSQFRHQSYGECECGLYIKTIIG